jgi:hypothetical protein
MAYKREYWENILVDSGFLDGIEEAKNYDNRICPL